MSMVLGKGVIANRFSDYVLQSKYLVFAGSVNDSAVEDIQAIKDEELAVKSALTENSGRTFIYFSSCSILDPDMCDTSYVLHKVRMEQLIQSSAGSFIIFRLPQVIGLSNDPSSLVNYLVDAILYQKNFELWSNAKRNIIDVDDVYDIVSEVLRSNRYINKIINVASIRQTLIPFLVQEVETFTGCAGNYVCVDKGSGYAIDVSEIQPILDELKLSFDENYINKSLNKYFSHLICSPKLISIIVPTYNEEYGIEEFYRRTKNVLAKLAPRFQYEIIFVNDFSTDGTLKKLELLAELDQQVRLISFSRNFGNQIGITAGIDFANGALAVVIDDDLQDPPEIILNLIAKWDRGYKVVYGVRPKRQGVKPLFRLTAKLYYRVISALSDTRIPNDTGDFRLMDRVVIDTLKKIKEENRYYRGLVAWVGFPQIGVVYERDERYAGVSTFSFKKYVNFALNGLTSFTEKPLYFSSLIGLIITLVSFVLAVILIIGKMLDPTVSIRGWTSLTVIILFFGGIQLLSAGVLGVYISKIYREVKGRPLYIIEKMRNIRSASDV